MSLTRSLQASAGPVLYAIAWIISLAAAFAGLEPLALVALLMFFVGLAILHLLGAGTFAPPHRQFRFLLQTMLAFAGYVLLSSLWSADWQLALEKGLLIILIIAGVGLTPPLIELMSPLQLHRCARGIVIGLLIGILFLVIEYLTDHAILMFVTELFPGLLKTLHGIKNIPPHHYNANVTVIVLFSSPALLAALMWKGGRFNNPFIAALLGAGAFLLYKTESETAQLAAFLAALAYLIAFYAPRAIDRITRGAWLIAVVGAVPIVMFVHYSGLQNISSLPYSFKDRIHIWHYTANLVPENPVLGIGIRSSRSYQQQPRRKIFRSQPAAIKDHQGWHSHNLFLQTWYELGAIGAAFLLVVGLLVLRAISTISSPKRPFAYASFTSFAVVAAFGYGMWQSWLLTAYGWSVIFLLIGLQYQGTSGISTKAPIVPE